MTITAWGAEHHPTLGCKGCSWEYTLWGLTLHLGPWPSQQAVNNHQENFLKRLAWSMIITPERPKQKQKLLNPSFYQEALRAFVCLLREWAAAQQLRHVWNIIALAFNCWMRRLMILERSGYCCKRCTAGRRQRWASKFTMLLHLQEDRIFVCKIHLPVDSLYWKMKKDDTETIQLWMGRWPCGLLPQEHKDSCLDLSCG